MSVYTSLFKYFYNNWASRCELVFPYSKPSGLGAPFSDDTTIIEVSITDVGKRTKSIPVESDSLRLEFYLLRCNLIATKHDGAGTVYGHLDQLESIFQNQNFEQDGVSYHFEECSRKPVVNDDLKVIQPWQCAFHVFNE